MISAQLVQNKFLETDDLAFSAWLKMEGYQIIKSHQIGRKTFFTFQLSKLDIDTLKMEFLNSRFLMYYNEIRNLKKCLTIK